VAPYPDAALKQVVSEVTASTDFHTDPRFPVAWRPDGKLLATILPGDTFNQDTQKVRISLLRTDTGEVAKTFTVTSSSSATAQGAEAILAWSPTGKQLAFMDTFSGTVTLWSSANLHY
jgi:Tol biopolymer transport system component